MKLSQLIADIEYIQSVGGTEAEIGGISADSRTVQRGDLFVCYTGGAVDSHDCAEEAYRKGASALICQKRLQRCPSPEPFTAMPIKSLR